MPERALHVVTVEDAPNLPRPNRLMVRTPHLDLMRLHRCEFVREEQWHARVSEKELKHNPQAFARIDLSVMADEPSPRALLDMLPVLRERQAAYIFGAEAAGDGTIVKMAASLGVPVRLLLDDGWPENLLANLVEYFLYSPTLKTPIEPLSTISETLGGARRTLWDIADEILGHNWYIDPEGRVTLSARWARRGAFFGAAGDSLEQLHASQLWLWLDGLKERIFCDQTPCAFCPHYACCGAFGVGGPGAGAVSLDESCPRWKAVMDMILAVFTDATTPGAQTCPTSS